MKSPCSWSPSAVMPTADRVGWWVADPGTNGPVTPLTRSTT
ncbi:hypothetical protein I553_1775 [Mycobacterium xenopi 4042]|uniref:Uncharacterized protein n=1 Tax=Mycobacterium xenopi 4042 TaxID=1299334 RepID=X8DIW6_MYCXE|nr:hypothetical protein I553_1775 [Mycobacterium xenopi 4042]